MTHALDYASRSTESRWSRMASYALGIGILQVPLFFLICLIGSVISPSRGDPANVILILMVLATLFVTPLVGLVMGFNRAIRCWASRGTLRGAWACIIGACLSAAWPVGFFCFILPGINLC